MSCLCLIHRWQMRTFIHPRAIRALRTQYDCVVLSVAKLLRTCSLHTITSSSSCFHFERHIRMLVIHAVIWWSTENTQTICFRYPISSINVHNVFLIHNPCPKWYGMKYAWIRYWKFIIETEGCSRFIGCSGRQVLQNPENAVMVHTQSLAVRVRTSIESLNAMDTHEHFVLRARSIYLLVFSYTFSYMHWARAHI